MSKMKHLLKKLHIGGGMNEHQRLGETRPVIRPNPATNSSVSPSSGSSSTPDSASLSTVERFGAVESVVDPSSGDFNFLEEEFQMQLALAISASDPAAREDPESAQIDAAKRMSLGCFPSVSDAHALVELQRLQYWSYNVINYGEKVLDGFYDIHCTTSNSVTQGKMPLLVDLLATSVCSDVNFDVILVNRIVDLELQQLERQAYTISMDCRDLKDKIIFSALIQKIAHIVVDRMGGPVDDTDEIFRKWNARSYELRSSLKTNVLPLGHLDVGLSRHRALLFKVLADRINLPCMLVKGSYYTDTDDGAINLIKVHGGSEYIIDLMGAPGMLIPSEPPGSQLANSGFGDMRIKETPISEPSGEILSNHDRVAEIGNLMSIEASFFEGSKTIKDDRNSDVQIQSGIDDKFRELSDLEHDPEITSDICGKRFSARKKKVKNVSKYVISAAKNPEFAQKLQAVLLESGASPPPDLFTDIASQGPVETKVLQQIHSVNGKNVEIFHGQSSEFSASDAHPLDSNVMESFDNVFHERNQKQSAERLVREKDPCFRNHEVSLQCSTTSEKVTPLFAGINEQIQVDATGGGTIQMIPRTTHQEYIEGPFMTTNTRSCQRQRELAWISNNKFTDKIESFPYKSAEKESENMKVKGVSGLHIASDVHAERVGPVSSEVAEWEIPWENINIGERIGIGSYGEVYRADWNSSEVAVKKFLDQDLSGDALAQLKSEVEIMLRLRHPNVVLFMGAVTRPPHFSILTEFLPRGSLYRWLHRSNSQLDEKRRLRMALDVAKGMNYLHTSHPTIVHRDLKSPNLLVDKNWVVKVCDFGLSRIKLHTFLSSKSTAGTPEWMAPEVLRNEPANEKCDVYSFGVILWELATCSIPWKGLNPMQVVGAVGFQDRRLEIPDDVDPAVAQIIFDCWQSETHLRPSFSQLMLRLRRLQRLVIDC